MIKLKDVKYEVDADEFNQNSVYEVIPEVYSYLGQIWWDNGHLEVPRKAKYVKFN